MEDDVPKWWNWIRAKAFDWKYQLALSAVCGIAAGLIYNSCPFALLKEPSAFQDFLLGLGAMLALVASLLFGFFLNYVQEVGNEKHLHYDRFKGNVADLREFLDRLLEEDVIDDGYDYAIGLIEEMTVKDFPALSFGERLDPLTKCVIDDNRVRLEQEDNLGRVVRGYGYRINDIEENVQALLVTWLKSLTAEHIHQEVVKSFATLIGVILLTIVSSLYFVDAVKTVLISIGVSMAIFTCLLFIEIALGLKREVREMFPIDYKIEHEELDENSHGVTKQDSEVANDELESIPLSRIKGIGPAIEARLNSVGLFSARDLAELTVDQAIERGEPIGFHNRTRWQRWIEEARLLCEITTP